MKTIIQGFLKPASSRSKEISYFRVLVVALRIPTTLVVAFVFFHARTEKELFAFHILATILLLYSAWVVAQASRRRK